MSPTPKHHEPSSIPSQKHDAPKTPCVSTKGAGPCSWSPIDRLPFISRVANRSSRSRRPELGAESNRGDYAYYQAKEGGRAENSRPGGPPPPSLQEAKKEPNARSMKARAHASQRAEALAQITFIKRWNRNISNSLGVSPIGFAFIALTGIPRHPSHENTPTVLFLFWPLHLNSVPLAASCRSGVGFR